MSEVSAKAIQAVLSEHFTQVNVTNVNDLASLEALVARSPDLVFLGMEFIPTNPDPGLANPSRIWLSDVFDNNAIAYTGSGQTAHELGRNKPLAKQRIIGAGLSTSAFRVVKQHQSLSRESLTLDFPLFIKPASGGGGQGIDSNSVAHSFEQARSKVRSITDRLLTDALIEEYLPGREFSVAILKNTHSTGYSAMSIELIAPPDINGSRLLSSKIKSSNTEQALEVTDRVIKRKVETLALGVFHALGARDYGRIDIRLDSAGIPHFLEANLIPSLISGYGSFPKACVLNIGLEYEPMILAIVRLGLARGSNIAQDVPIFSTELAKTGRAMSKILRK